MTPNRMEHLLSLGTPLVTKLSTNYRKPIPPEQRLSLILSHLATGESQISLSLQNCIERQAEVESMTQGSRPRTQKKSEAKAKDSLSEDRHSRGQGQECSRPRPRTTDTSASALQKKRSSQKFFRRSPQKNVFQTKNFSGAPQSFNNSKNSAVLEPRTGQFSRT